MSLDSEFRLSFYREIAMLNEQHKIALVQHADSGKVYVRKTLPLTSEPIIQLLMKERYAGIPQIIEMIPDPDGQLVVIEEYISGRSIDERLKDHLFTESEAAGIIRSLCRTLEPLHAHDPQLVHRDIKASNVIISESGSVYLLDFDASKFVDPAKSSDTQLLGTQDYAAPEQFGFRQSDSRTDIYALGVLLHRMVTGRFLNGSTEGPSYQGALAPIIHKCTAMEPSMRYQTVEELSKALDKVIRKLRTETAGASSSLGKWFHPLKVQIRQIPGYRKMFIPWVILATLWYALVLWLSLTLEVKAMDGHSMSGFPLYVERAVTLFFFGGVTFYLGNYKGIRDRFPYRRKKQSAASEALRLLLGVVLMLLVVFIVIGIFGE